MLKVPEMAVFSDPIQAVIDEGAPLSAKGIEPLGELVRGEHARRTECNI